MLLLATLLLDVEPRLLVVLLLLVVVPLLVQILILRLGVPHPEATDLSAGLREGKIGIHRFVFYQPCNFVHLQLVHNLWSANGECSI